MIEEISSRHSKATLISHPFFIKPPLFPMNEYTRMQYRVTHLVDENLPLTQFRQFRQLVGSYCSYLLPKQVDRAFKIQVNWRFSSTRCVILMKD